MSISSSLTALLTTCLLALLASCTAPPTSPPPRTVPHVDLNRYLGTWYEITKLPNRFQKQCAGNTTAEYALRSDGRLDVINRCRTHDGGLDEARGVARVTESTTNAKLEVSFVSILGWQLFWGDYWIMDLPADYAYAIVGAPSRRYGWVLSRTPTLSAQTRYAIRQRLRELGYAPERFEDTRQGLDG